MIDLKTLTTEDELIIIEQGVKTPFWELLQARLGQKALTAVGAALSERVEQRDWTAGRANGLREALKYPSDRIRDLKTKLEQQKPKA